MISGLEKHILTNTFTLTKSRARGWQGGLPSLAHVCRFLRDEVLSFFYGTNRVTVVLEDLIMHPQSINRRQSCINLIPKDGTLYWRAVKIESCARCFHDSGFARQPNVDAKIDRVKSTVSCGPRYERWLNKCCLTKANEYSMRLEAQIKAGRLQEGNRKLRRDDFERLMRRMDPNRRDWPKSPRRVVPRYLAG